MHVVHIYVCTYVLQDINYKRKYKINAEEEKSKFLPRPDKLQLKQIYSYKHMHTWIQLNAYIRKIHYELTFIAQFVQPGIHLKHTYIFSSNNNKKITKAA